MNQQEELVLEILSNVDVVKGKTKFVKILHFTCKLFEENKKTSPFSFIDDKYGVNTRELDPVLQKLETNGFIKIHKNFLLKRIDLAYMQKPYEILHADILAMKSKISSIVRILNPYSAEDIIAFSYSTFPDTAVNSKIKPKINKRIVEVFSPLSIEYDEAAGEEDKGEILIKSTVEVKKLYPEFNDMDARIHMMKSLGLKELPPIIPDMIDESTGLLAKKHPFFKNYNLEAMLKDARRR